MKDTTLLKTMTLTTHIPATRRVQIDLPDDIPTGPVEMVIVVTPQSPQREHTLGELLASEFFGLWRDRRDLDDPVAYARELRNAAWSRPK